MMEAITITIILTLISIVLTGLIIWILDSIKCGSVVNRHTHKLQNLSCFDKIAIWVDERGIL